MENILSTVLSSIVTILIFIAVIGALVFIHEFGHFLAAKIIKAKVLQFALGLGPKLFGRRYKGTEYKVNLLPSGGYVNIKGEIDQEESKDKDSFQNKKPFQRILVMIAGIVCNLILAITIYYILFASVGYKVYFARDVSNFKPIGGTITYEILDEKIVFEDLKEDGGAKKAGFPETGYLKKINDKELVYSYEVENILNENKGKTVKINVCVEEKCKDYMTEVDLDGNLGLSLYQNYIYVLSYENVKWISGIVHPINVIKLSFFAISDIFKQAKISGDYSEAVNTVSGPVGIYLAIDEFKKFGAVAIFSLVADLSTALAFMNILPIPALDGGRILLIIPEIITGKRLNKKFEIILINVTYIILLGLMLLIFIKDFIYIDTLRSLLK